MKNTFLSLVIGLGLVSTAFAQEEQKSEPFYTGNELSVSLGTTYGGVNDSFRDDYDFNLNAGVTYYITKNIGAEVSLPFYSDSDFRVEKVYAGPLFRVPIDRFAPYVGAGVVYSWSDAETDYVGTAGLEFKIKRGWSVYVEGTYTVNDFNQTNLEHGEWLIGGGINLNIF